MYAHRHTVHLIRQCAALHNNETKIIILGAIIAIIVMN